MERSRHEFFLSNVSDRPLQICLDRHYRQAASTFRLDDELGILHGLSWANFVLLNALDAAGGEMSTADLAQKLSVPRSRLLLQLIPLEKTGLIAPHLGPGGIRRIFLRPNGRGKMVEAQETATRLCEEILEN